MQNGLSCEAIRHYPPDAPLVGLTWEQAEALYPGSSAGWDVCGGNAWVGAAEVRIERFEGQLCVRRMEGITWTWAFWYPNAERWVWL